MVTQVFFDADGHGRAVFELMRVENRPGKYLVRRTFSYRDPQHPEWVFVVPQNQDTFVTDLASVPPLLTWLVPKDGTHTPAAILHDSLLNEAHQDGSGKPVTGQIADHVFRNALRYLGVPFVRSWMMWSAVSLRTLVSKGQRLRWWWIFLIAAVSLVFGAGGIIQMLDLVDAPIWDLELPWMGDRPIWQELLNATLAVLAVGAASLVLWGRWWQLGLVAALALPVIAFPLLVCALAYLGYLLVEGGLFVILRGRPAGPDAELAPVPPPRVKALDAMQS